VDAVLKLLQIKPLVNSVCRESILLILVNAKTVLQITFLILVRALVLLVLLVPNPIQLIALFVVHVLWVPSLRTKEPARIVLRELTPLTLDLPSVYHAVAVLKRMQRQLAAIHVKKESSHQIIVPIVLPVLKIQYPLFNPADVHLVQQVLVLMQLMVDVSSVNQDIIPQISRLANHVQLDLFL